MHVYHIVKHLIIVTQGLLLTRS